MPLTPIEKHALTHFRERLVQVLADATLELHLFGSKARGDDRPDSDVDVLVVVSGEDWRIADRVYAVATDVQLATGVVLSPKVLSHRKLQELRQREWPFINNVLRESSAV